MLSFAWGCYCNQLKTRRCYRVELVLFWDKLLKAKTTGLIFTMDIPKWSYWLINRDAGHNVMKIGVLEFFGMKPEKISVFSGIKSSDDIKRNSGLKKLWN